MKNYLLLLLYILTAHFAFGQKEKTKIACIGNSITYGYTLKHPEKNSYPALLQEQMGDKYIVKNFGHSGATLMRKGYNPYYKTKEFKAALAFAPDEAIICIGINDTDPRTWPKYKDQFIPDYNWLIDTLKSVNPEMKVYICSLMPVFTGHPRFMSSTYDWFWEAQRKIKKVAKTNGLQYIDLYSAFHSHPNLITDAWTLHPNAKGYAKMSHVIYKNITGDFGGLDVADIFTDNMVLQRNKPIRVWGIADAESVVKVTFNGKTKSVTTPTNGKWMVTFDAAKASEKPHTLMVENEDQKESYSNILIGDVWLCSGQSNMLYTLAEAMGGKKAAANAEAEDNLRLFKYVPFESTSAHVWDSIALKKANELDFFHGSWKLNEKDAASAFSAVGYWFGKKIQEEENIPIGLIELAVGGSPQISWVSRSTLEANALFEPALHDWRHSDYIMKWCRQRAAYNLKNSTVKYQRHPYDPSFNFESGIAKITHFPIKGVVWYQGASDATNPELYSKLFPVFVKEWRQHWGYDFPFYYVQLSSLNRPAWPHFRNAQRKLLKKVPHSGMAVTSDLGSRTQVHYQNKKPVGLRLAMLALHDTYGKKNIVPSGPLVKLVNRKKDRIIVSFSNNKGLTTADGDGVRGFEIVNHRGFFVAVSAKIKKDKIIIDVPENMKAEKVVYGWDPYSTANLVNKAGLPASTFMIKVK